MKKSKKKAIAMAVLGLNAVSAVTGIGSAGGVLSDIANVAEAADAAGQYTIYYEGYKNDQGVVANKYGYVFGGFNSKTVQGSLRYGAALFGMPKFWGFLGTMLHCRNKISKTGQKEKSPMLGFGLSVEGRLFRRLNLMASAIRKRPDRNLTPNLMTLRTTDGGFPCLHPNRRRFHFQTFTPKSLPRAARPPE